MDVTHVGWSGNSVLSAERLPYTQGVIGGGELLFGGEVTLDDAAGEGQSLLALSYVSAISSEAEAESGSVPAAQLTPQER